jgi:uncharacterized ferredoxin-like protein
MKKITTQYKIPARMGTRAIIQCSFCNFTSCSEYDVKEHEGEEHVAEKVKIGDVFCL